jgi:DNA-binding PadR family transcriptional regulator
LAKGFQVNEYEVMFFMALGDRPAYGYELAARFSKMSGGHMKVSYGTIYPFLRRMERRGVIRSRKDEKTGRVYYELTQRGIDAKKDVMKRLKEYQKELEEKLLGILSMHAEVFGQKALSDILKRARQTNRTGT